MSSPLALNFIVRDTGGLPLTRLWRGARYAVSLLRAAPWLTRDLTWETAARTAAGAVGAAFGAVGLLILFDGGRYGALGEFIADLRLAVDPGPIGTSMITWGIVNEVGTIALGDSCVIIGLACAILGWTDSAGREVRQVFAVPAYVGAIGMIPLGVGGILIEVAGMGITGSMPGLLLVLSALVPLLLAALMIGVVRWSARASVAMPG